MGIYFNFRSTLLNILSMKNASSIQLIESDELTSRQIYAEGIKEIVLWNFLILLLITAKTTS